MSDKSANLSVAKTFASLRHPNYRLWFIGQLVSLMGTWMQNTAQGYLIYELTESTTYLGIVSFAAGIPTWLFTLFGGVIADRIPRRTLLRITQSAAMFLAFILAVLVFFQWVQPWMVIILAFLLGTVNAFEAPVRISFVRELVDDREDMPNAIALNATMFNTAAVVGPAVGGLVYAAVGPGWCFTINGISFIAVLIALWLMRLSPFIPPKQTSSTLLQLKEGLAYAWGESNIRYILASTAMISIFGFGLFTLMPAWARDVLGGDAATNGLLLSGRGLGSMIGALMVATLSHLKMRGRMWTIGSFVLSLCAVWFALMRWLPLSLLALVGLGWGLMSMVNINNAIIQMQVPDALRGRVMGIYSLLFQGGMPIGSLIAGTVAAQIKEPLTVIGSAMLLLAFACFTWLLRPQLRTME